ncbi:MAG TPA: hypothetical protein VKZ85_03350 [Woeseiaceae bacterium]|nr:hypothetical protein [Woeseiaceae bacterium]
MIDLSTFQLSAMLQARQRLHGQRPGEFGRAAAIGEGAHSPITGRPAPEHAEDVSGEKNSTRSARRKADQNRSRAR